MKKRHSKRKKKAEVEVIGRPLATISKDLDAALEAVRFHAAATVESAYQAGQLLIEAKAALRHGEWTPWLSKHNLAPSTANDYMRLARVDAQDINELKDLGVRKALKAIAAPTTVTAALNAGDADATTIKHLIAEGDTHALDAAVKYAKAGMIPMRPRPPEPPAVGDPPPADFEYGPDVWKHTIAIRRLVVRSVGLAEEWTEFMWADLITECADGSEVVELIDAFIAEAERRIDPDKPHVGDLPVDDLPCAEWLVENIQRRVMGVHAKPWFGRQNYADFEAYQAGQQD